MKNNLAQSLELQPNDLPALKKTENLPFTIRVAQDAESIEKAVRIRREAYGRHLPELAANMTQPDDADFAPGTTVLLAESKFDGKPLGTMRIQTNEFNSLKMEESVMLPSWLSSKKLAEATRLGVAIGNVGRIVKVNLFKAYYLYCKKFDIDWMVICAREPVDAQYEKLLFEDVFKKKVFSPMKHIGNIPHRVLAFNVLGAEKLWRREQHPLTEFVFETFHPDIKC